MNKKVILLAAVMAAIFAGTANAELKPFKVNGQVVSVGEQKEVYDRAVAQGQKAGPELERQVKALLTQEVVLLQAAKNSKLDKRPDVQKAIKNATNQVLVQALAQDWIKSHPVSEADLKKAYNEAKARYGNTEYQVRHIVVQDENQARTLIARLNKGADFNKLANDFSIDQATKAQGGLLNWIVPAAVPAEFAKVFTALKPGQIAQQPVRLQDGYHIVKLDSTRKAQLFPTYETQKPVLTQLLTNQSIQQHFADLVKNARVQ